MKSWQAFNGTAILDCGTTRAGKPRRALCTLILVAHTATDAKALAKAHPQLKFVEIES